MKPLKKIKMLLIKQKKWKNYKLKFKHKQMKMVFSKVAIIFNKHSSITKLVKIEIGLINTVKESKMFWTSFKQMEPITGLKADWRYFANFLWYQYQTSTYYSDKKRKIKNIYNEKNYIKLNSKKRDNYQKWINSLNPYDSKYNNHIVKVLKVIS